MYAYFTHVNGKSADIKVLDLDSVQYSWKSLISFENSIDDDNLGKVFTYNGFLLLLSSIGTIQQFTTENDLHLKQSLSLKYKESKADTVLE